MAAVALPEDIDSDAAAMATAVATAALDCGPQALDDGEDTAMAPQGILHSWGPPFTQEAHSTWGKPAITYLSPHEFQPNGWVHGSEQLKENAGDMGNGVPLELSRVLGLDAPDLPMKVFGRFVPSVDPLKSIGAELLSQLKLQDVSVKSEEFKSQMTWAPEQKRGATTPWSELKTLFQQPSKLSSSEHDAVADTKAAPPLLPRPPGLCSSEVVSPDKARAKTQPHAIDAANLSEALHHLMRRYPHGAVLNDIKRCVLPGAKSAQEAPLPSVNHLAEVFKQGGLEELFSATAPENLRQDLPVTRHWDSKPIVPGPRKRGGKGHGGRIEAW